MCICSIIDGWLLGDRLFSNGSDITHSNCHVSGFGYTQYGRYMRLLHERYNNGVHWWFDSCYCYWAQQSPPQDCSYSYEDGWLQPCKITWWSMCSHDLYIHVGVKYRGYCYDGAHNICCFARVGTSIIYFFSLIFDNSINRMSQNSYINMILCIKRNNIFL